MCVLSHTVYVTVNKIPEEIFASNLPDVLKHFEGGFSRGYAAYFGGELVSHLPTTTKEDRLLLEVYFVWIKYETNPLQLHCSPYTDTLASVLKRMNIGDDHKVTLRGRTILSTDNIPICNFSTTEQTPICI